MLSSEAGDRWHVYEVYRENYLEQFAEPTHFEAKSTIIALLSDAL
tara:strand:- start:27924 stop:28058 length:135 start_codon:yes stop_codon:yes gene_type:complete